MSSGVQNPYKSTLKSTQNRPVEMPAERKKAVLRSGDGRHASGRKFIKYTDIRPSAPPSLSDKVISSNHGDSKNEATRDERVDSVDIEAEAHRLWKSLISELRHFGLLTALDLHSIEDYCRLQAEVSSLRILLRRASPSSNAKSEYVRLNSYYQKKLDLKFKLACQLGLTPKSRAEITAQILQNDEMLTRLNGSPTKSGKPSQPDKEG